MRIGRRNKARDRKITSLFSELSALRAQLETFRAETGKHYQACPECRESFERMARPWEIFEQRKG